MDRPSRNLFRASIEESDRDRWEEFLALAEHLPLPVRVGQRDQCNKEFQTAGNIGLEDSAPTVLSFRRRCSNDEIDVMADLQQLLADLQYEMMHLRVVVLPVD